MKQLFSTSLSIKALSEKKLFWVVRFLFAVSAFLIVVLSISYHSINQELLYYSERVDHTHAVLDQIQKIKSEVFATTYYGRGFLLQGDAVNRLDMLSKARGLPLLADSLRLLVEDNIVQVRRTAKLKDSLLLYSNKIQKFSLKNPIILGIDERNSLVRSGSQLTSNISQFLTTMEEMENILKINRTRSRDTYKERITQFNWLIMTVALVILLAAYILLERELTRNKLYKIELENKIEDLNNSNNELEQLAYVASHDLQEPLRKIRSFIDLLTFKESGTWTSTGKMTLQKIDKSASRMQLLIDDLLSFLRTLETSKELEDVDLNEVIKQVVVNLSPALKANKAVAVYPTLPTVHGYSTQLVQLFENLVSNSIKYKQPNIDPIIELSSNEVDGWDIPNIRASQKEEKFYCLSLKDNGIGFRKEFAEKIFVIFQRLHGRDEYEGSGIGLSICRKVVANHKGYIVAHGEENSGAEFCIYLPK